MPAAMRSSGQAPNSARGRGSSEAKRKYILPGTLRQSSLLLSLEDSRHPVPHLHPRAPWEFLGGCGQCRPFTGTGLARRTVWLIFALGCLRQRSGNGRHVG